MLSRMSNWHSLDKQKLIKGVCASLTLCDTRCLQSWWWAENRSRVNRRLRQPGLSERMRGLSVRSPSAALRGPDPPSSALHLHVERKRVARTSGNMNYSRSVKEENTEKNICRNSYRIVIYFIFFLLVYFSSDWQHQPSNCFFVVSQWPSAQLLLLPAEAIGWPSLVWFSLNLLLFFIRTVNKREAFTIFIGLVIAYQIHKVLSKGQNITILPANKRRCTLALIQLIKVD